MRGGDFQNGVQPITPTVKKLIIANLAIWFFLVLIVQNFVMKDSSISYWFGLVPGKMLASMWVWQPFTYMFLHSENVFHIVFNMLLLWWLGSELEMLWGKKFFTFYYFACGIGAAFIYVGSVVVYYLVTGKPMVVPMNVMMNSSNPMWEPVVGASGAVFGLILAYGMLFGERTVLFFMLFPMKARYFVMILAGIEFFSLIGQGFSSQVSNLAHLGGFIVGYLILRVTPRLKEYLVRRQTENRGRRLKLVVDNESQKNPKYWN